MKKEEECENILIEKENEEIDEKLIKEGKENDALTEDLNDEIYKLKGIINKYEEENKINI